MYLFNRSLKLAPGNTLDSMAWATKMTEKVNAVGGVEVHLWTRVFGADIGTITWSAIVDDMVQLTTLEEKLGADGGYMDLVEEGARFGDGSGVNDTLGRLVHADPDGMGSAQFASITLTQIAPGMMATGIALGIEMAQMVKSITGRPTSFGSSVTGPYGQVAFFSMSDTVEQLQAANEALAENADFVAAVDSKASKAYVAGVTEQMISRKIV